MEQLLIQTIKGRIKAVEFDINSLEINLKDRVEEDHRLRMRLEFHRKIKHGFEEALDGLDGLNTTPAYAGMNHA